MPKVNQKYQISPSYNTVGNTISIAGFMGIKQESKSDNSNNTVNNAEERK